MKRVIPAGGTLVLALALLPAGTATIVSPASAQSTGWCQAMNSRYAAAVNLAIRKRCPVTTAIPGAMFFRRCLQNNPNVTARSVGQWENYARTCRPNAAGQGGQGGNLRAYCQNVSSAIVNEVRRARNKGCNVNTAWTRGRYFNWCLTAGRAAASGQLRQWANYARTCRGQARPDRRIFCQVQSQVIVRAVNQARNRGCVVNTAWSYNRYYNWCLRSNNAAVISQRQRWRAYARTCRRAGGRPGGGQPGGGAQKRQACNAYANTAVSQRAQYGNRGCFNDNNIWSPNRAVHFNYCMRVGPGQAAQLTRHRAGQIQACGWN